MQLHLVGGFLGSGKTTAIITAARTLIGEGKKVGVVTNDRGRHLVDTFFFKNSNVHTVEIAQGCFRCNFDELEEKLAQLEIDEKPDIVFAESVGSCSDLVATVIKPLLDLENSKTPPASFTVFTDSQLLLAHLQGLELPFSENVMYIFEKQIEEAKLLILNKADLLNDDEIREITDLATKAYPDKTIKLQNSTRAEDVIGWLEMLEKNENRLPQKSIEIDYRRYGIGEMRLAWLDQALIVETTELEMADVIKKIIHALQKRLRKGNITIGHLKFLITTPEANVKISLPTMDQIGWEQEVECVMGHSASLLINARIEMPALELQSLVNSTLLEISSEPGIKIQSIHNDSFHPGFPEIPYRISG